MNHKGFTLVELLAVIVLLGIIITITGTGVMTANKTAREKIYKNKISNIEDAAILYAQDNKTKFSNETCIIDSVTNCKENSVCYCYKDEISVSVLINEGYIKGDNDSNLIIDPRDEKKDLNDCKIKIYKKYNKIYSFVINEGVCNE